MLFASVGMTYSGAAVAQLSKPAASASAAARPASTAAPVRPVTSRPVWAELTVQQQQALRPLAPGWDTISEAQKRKWLEISKSFAALPPEGQLTLHSRMTEWVGLSPQQRAQARLNFGKTRELSRELTAEEKKAKWQSYQALSLEEKQSLAARASPQPTGAATAVRPVAPQKLAVIPPALTPRASAPARKPALQPQQSGDSVIFSEPVTGPSTPQPQR